MDEHTFEDELVECWREVADRARHEFDQWTSVSERASPQANAALLELKHTLAETVGTVVAEWSVTHWLITREPIEVCVRTELAERRPWPSQAARLRGVITPPSR